MSADDLERGRIEHGAFEARAAQAGDEIGADVEVEFDLGDAGRLDVYNVDADLAIELKPEHGDEPPELVAERYADQIDRYDEAVDEVMLATYDADGVSEEISLYAPGYESHVVLSADEAAAVIASAEDPDPDAGPDISYDGEGHDDDTGPVDGDDGEDDAGDMDDGADDGADDD